MEKKSNVWLIRSVPASVRTDTKVLAARRGQTMGAYVTEALIYFNRGVLQNVQRHETAGKKGRN